MPNYVYIATSLDGFIADSGGGLDWLNEVSNPDNGDYGYSDFMRGIDAIVMGRRTFETVLTFGAWPYDKPVFVLSTTIAAAPEALVGRAEIVRGDLHRLMDALHARGFDNLYVDGGRTIQGFLAADLIDEMIITRIPVLLGSGVPLFGSIGRKLAFVHEGTRALTPALTQSRYVRNR